MEKILNDLEQHSSWKELMRSSCRRNALNTSLAADLTILKLRQLDQRFKKSSLENMATSWIQNELKAFNWILIALSSLSDTLIKDFREEEWNIMKKVFPFKDMTFLKFQARKLVDGHKSKNRWWSKEQEQMLIHEASKYDKNAINWNEVAHRMFQNSKGAIFRSGKHCREHWLNHLDPNKQRGAWTFNEDIILLEKVANGGKKWSQYASILKRTEHTVKNRYNSLVIKQKKLTPSIKKEQKLVKQLRARLQAHKASQLRQKQDEKEMKKQSSYQSLSEQEESIHQMPPSISQKVQEKSNFILEKQQKKHLPVTDMLLKQQSKKEQICDAYEKSEKIEVQNPLSNYLPALIPNCDLNFLMKEDNQQMKKTIFSQFPRYSPYSPYSPYILSPNTPSNYLPSAPVYLSSQFYNYYHQFMSSTDISQQSQQESRQNPTKTSPD